jgi:uncharacterized protein (DUF362 family)/NAD-dependent dihydropyrimidine dehydrogenase PreA subunit
MYNISTVFISKGDNPKRMLEAAFLHSGGLSSILPNKTESILIKGNFGCHKPSVTGATTDLRVVVALIELLQSEGYYNIFVGDGGMAGYLKIDLLSYLGVTQICERYGVTAVDLNKHDATTVKLRSGATVKMSKLALESKVIDVAKLKTHVLATVTLGIKNLMGCVVGNDKREIHLNGLDQNLANLPFVVKPAFIIIEGLTGMEGRGPVAGTPIKSNLIVTSRDVIAGDVVASKLMGFDPYAIPHIKYAINLSSNSYKWQDIKLVGTSFDKAFTPFEKAIALGMEGNPFINTIKHMVRNTPIQTIIVYLMSIKKVATMINRLGILQEELDHAIPIYPPKIIEELCIGCGFCKNVCPVNAISVKERKCCIDPERCVKCYCCVETCPHGIIK